MERGKFENKEVTFEDHIKREHSLWHYLYFIVHVKTKEATEYTGPESYVSDMINVRMIRERGGGEGKRETSSDRGAEQ